MSIIAERLQSRVELTQAERALLLGLESRSVSCPRRSVLSRSGEPNRKAFVLKSGWVISYSRLANGSKQVRRLHLPGDLLGMPSLAFRHNAEELEAVSDVVVSPFSKLAFGRLFETHHRLAGLMFLISQLERVTLGDRLLSVATQPCKSRLAFLLMDILNRLRRIDPGIVNTMPMHLSREQMAEITGMTPIHASRMWSELTRDGIISNNGGLVTVQDEVRLLELSGWVTRTDDLDLGWLPTCIRSRSASLAYGNYRRAKACQLDLNLKHSTYGLLGRRRRAGEVL